MNRSDWERLRKAGRARLLPTGPRVAVGYGTCGIGNGADTLFAALETACRGTDILLVKSGCFGLCAEEPLVFVQRPGLPIVIFARAQAKDAAKLVAAALSDASLAKAAGKALAQIDRWDFRLDKVDYGKRLPKLPLWNEIGFFAGQEKLILRSAGLINPESLAEYCAVGGYGPLLRAVTEMKPEDVIAEVKTAGLRGRGGAGFPTGRKWELLRAQPGKEKYLVCNADEGDPGAFMNRNEIESDPHMLVEGMAIGAYATGADRGFVYVRAEYPLAVERLEKALADAREAGFIGKNVFGSGFSFDLELVTGAGAFVCGEETALIASAEGKAGRPLPRPPFPAQRGYLGRPTNINNVETWCNVPLIVGAGAAAFQAVGTAKNPGTKVFSLVGKVRNTGLVELPLGTKLDSIVFGMGAGAGVNKRLKAVQTGGPSGGCIPAERFDVAVDYESLAAIGAIMGSGGMVAMDGDNCMVDVARYFVSFTAAESCGKCTPCREGLSQMLAILDRITAGRGKLGDLDDLERLALTVKDGALCGLGQTAANPVLTTLQYFRSEYERHILDQRCEAGVCESLFSALCENSCPLHMNIPGYLALLQAGRIEEAFELTLRDNPLPGSVGRICHFHCQMRCRREALDEPVAQGEIHRYLADTMYKLGREKEIWDKLAKEKAPATGKKIAIVGAGPAGLTAAFYLARLGHAVTIYESHAKAGGILRYGIPAYRLPKETLDKELGLWKRLGVDFVYKTTVGRDVAALAAANDAVLVAVGAQGDRALGIRGEELKGVHPGYRFLEELTAGKLSVVGQRVAVIGGGNVAIDVARTLFRKECAVTVYYRRTRGDMTANAAELAGAEEEGIRFEFLTAPEAVIGNGKVRALKLRRMKAGPIDRTGRPIPVATDEIFEAPVDLVVAAVGEKVDSVELAAAGLAAAHDGRLSAGRTGQVGGLPNVWAAGDAVTGPATAAEAMGQAKRAAAAIDKALTGADRFAALFKPFDYGMTAPADQGASPMHRSGHVPPEQRRGNFQEISLGYSGEQALAEAARCLRCDIRANARSPWR
jgi:NADH-quinone oxidoreductase subunit F